MLTLSGRYHSAFKKAGIKRKYLEDFPWRQDLKYLSIPECIVKNADICRHLKRKRRNLTKDTEIMQMLARKIIAKHCMESWTISKLSYVELLGLVKLG